MLAAEEADAIATSATSGLPVVAAAAVPSPAQPVTPAPTAAATSGNGGYAQAMEAAVAPVAPVAAPVADVTATSAMATSSSATADEPELLLESAEVGNAKEFQDGDNSPRGSRKGPGVFGKLGMREESVTGLNVRQRVGETAQKLAEHEKIQQGMAVATNIKTSAAATASVAQMVAQEGVKVAKEKASENIEFAREKANKGVEIAKERAKEGYEIAKEKTAKLREGAGSVWERGRGTISKARTNVGKIAWRGSARETLDVSAREEHWQNIKVQGAEEMTVPARTEHTTAYHVSKGSTLRWTFRVKEKDIGFGVRIRVQEWGGAREDEVLSVERYDSEDTISGSWVADENRIIVLVFDNRYSRLRGKTVAYFVGTEKPSDAAPVETAAAAAPVAPAPAVVSAPIPAAAPAPEATQAAAAPAANSAAVGAVPAEELQRAIV